MLVSAYRSIIYPNNRPIQLDDETHRARGGTRNKSCNFRVGCSSQDDEGEVWLKKDLGESIKSVSGIVERPPGQSFQILDCSRHQDLNEDLAGASVLGAAQAVEVLGRRHHPFSRATSFLEDLFSNRFWCRQGRELAIMGYGASQNGTECYTAAGSPSSTPSARSSTGWATVGF